MVCSAKSGTTIGGRSEPRESQTAVRPSLVNDAEFPFMLLIHRPLIRKENPVGHSVKYFIFLTLYLPRVKWILPTGYL